MEYSRLLTHKCTQVPQYNLTPCMWDISSFPLQHQNDFPEKHTKIMNIIPRWYSSKKRITSSWHLWQQTSWFLFSQLLWNKLHFAYRLFACRTSKEMWRLFRIRFRMIQHWLLNWWVVRIIVLYWTAGFG